MILFHKVIEILYLTDLDVRLMFAIVAVNRSLVGTTLVDRDLLRRAVPVDGFAEKSQCSLAIALGGQQKIHRGTGFVDRAIQILPTAFDLHVGLVHPPAGTHRLLAGAKFRLQQWDIFDHPTIELRIPLILINQNPGSSAFLVQPAKAVVQLAFDIKGEFEEAAHIVFRIRFIPTEPENNKSYQ